MDLERLQLHVLGVGNGSSAVYRGEPSTALLLTRDREPLLLLDLGLGVARACLTRFGGLPPRVYISHNHADHAGELPVVLAVESARGRRLEVLAVRPVMDRLIRHRLHELRSSVGSPRDLGDLVPLERDRDRRLGEGIGVRPLRARHAEPCWGLLISVDGRSLVGWSADSGFDEELYERLWAAPTVVLDGRARGNPDHASFCDIEEYVGERPARQVVVVGHGDAAGASTSLRLGRAGDAIDLRGHA